MRLTTFTDYTFRVLTYLGLHPKQLATVTELADAYDISRNHLTKVVHYLGQKGYIETLRGKGGGIRLALSPDKIQIGLLVRDTEKGSLLVECFSQGRGDCKIVPACRLTGILQEAQQAFFLVLDKYTLSDLITNPRSLEELLS
ncbi:MAG: Rrf2 family transcriptional regulator [Sedimenticola sp.]|nr:Rrf2 family transcriptional regulator [Sedimenticola sp.]